MPGDDGDRNLKEVRVDKQQEAFAEAERRIAEALRTKAMELDLSKLGLSAVPENLGKLDSLQNLDLSDNHLSALPESLCQLGSLQRLFVCGNQIRSLPDGISQLDSLREIDVSSNRLSALSENLGQLASIKSIDLNDNELSTLPESLGQLASLQSLFLGNNRLRTLPENLGQLGSLKVLSLWSNQLSAVPESLIQLTSLELLILHGNQLSSLPESIGQLASLEELYLGKNQLISLPESLGQLGSLLELYLGDNQLRAVPESLGQLASLQLLSLCRNQLSAVPGSLAQLGSLRELNLSDNQLSSLPQSFRTMNDLKTLFLHGNPGLFLSAELLGPSEAEVYDEKMARADPQSILDYYFGIMAGARPLNEVKLLLVGRGKAGKSCIKDALFGRPFDRDKQETPGIDIEVSPGRLESPDGDVTVHVWDFAGQTITHATHQFFLTERSIYLLVIEGRMNTQNQDAEYWLKLISGFGKDSPVIICLNKHDEVDFSLNEVALRAKYPAIRAIVKTDCRTRRGLEDLDREIQAAVESIPEVRQKFPLAWWDAKERFSRMTADYLSLDDFRRECSAHGESDAHLQISLARILHQLGIVLHFSGDDDLKEIAVLNPHWVTQNIYRLLRLKQGPESDGTLTQAEAAAALEGATEPEVAYLLGLMRKFELCFPVTGRPDVLLVPDLLPENPVQDLGDWRSDRRDLLRLRYEYTVLPEGLIPRFITRTYPLSQNQPRWRYGVVLETDGGRALVLAAEPRIEVSIAGPAAAQERIAKVIRHHFAHLNAQFGGLEPTEWIEVREFPGKYQRVDALLKDEQRGKPSMIITDEGTELIDQKAELDRISSETSRKEKGKRLRVFISYAHADTDMFDLFRSANLAAMESDRLISSWTDRKISPGQKWDAAIKEELESCDVMLCLVSTKFFASEYIRGVEMKRAMEREKEGKIRIVPVLLEDCPAWDRSELKAFQAIIPDGKPVRFHDRRPDDAFNVVERRLAEMIAAM